MPIYIGVYLKVPLKAVQKPKEGLICANASCEQHGHKMRAKFCPFCGSAAVPNTGTEEKLVGYQHSDLDNEHQDVLTTIDATYGADKGFQYVIPNSREGSSIQVDENDLGEFPYPPNAEETDRARFAQRYGPLAEAIMEEFPGTELKIGLVAYY